MKTPVKHNGRTFKKKSTKISIISKQSRFPRLIIFKTISDRKTESLRVPFMIMDNCMHSVSNMTDLYSKCKGQSRLPIYLEYQGIFTLSFPDVLYFSPLPCALICMALNQSDIRISHCYDHLDQNIDVKNFRPSEH